MPTVAIVPAQFEHASQLAPLLRAGDLAECLAAGYPDAKAALDDALVNSTEAVAILFDGEIAALVGADDYGQGLALIWALTGVAVDRARLTFLRTSRQVLAMLRRGRRLFNIVDVRYQGAFDWLECLGFFPGRTISHPRTGAPFRVMMIGGA